MSTSLVKLSFRRLTVVGVTILPPHLVELAKPNLGAPKARVYRDSRIASGSNELAQFHGRRAITRSAQQPSQRPGTAAGSTHHRTAGRAGHGIQSTARANAAATSCAVLAAQRCFASRNRRQPQRRDGTLQIHPKAEKVALPPAESGLELHT